VEESDHCQDRQSSCTCTRLISIVVSLFKAFAQKSSCLWVVDVFSTKTPSDTFQHHYQHGVWRGLKRSPTFWPLSWRIFDNAMYIWNHLETKCYSKISKPRNFLQRSDWVLEVSTELQHAQQLCRALFAKFLELTTVSVGSGLFLYTCGITHTYCIYIYIYNHTHTHIYIYTHVYIIIHIYTCIHNYTHTYIYIYS